MTTARRTEFGHFTLLLLVESAVGHRGGMGGQTIGMIRYHLYAQTIKQCIAFTPFMTTVKRIEDGSLGAVLFHLMHI
jgi:hypothetical protein